MMQSVVFLRRSTATALPELTEEQRIRQKEEELSALESVHMAESECAAPGLNTLEPECVTTHSRVSDVHQTHVLVKIETDLGSTHTQSLMKTESLDYTELEYATHLHPNQIKREAEDGGYIKAEHISHLPDICTIMATSSNTGAQLAPNSVRSLQLSPFERRTLAEKLIVKELGPDKPEVKMTQPGKKKEKTFTRSFCRGWFDRKAWLTSCGSANAIFCFPCLLFKTSACDRSWTQTGVTDLKHMSERIKKHERTRMHMDNCVKLAMLGRVSIATQLDEGHRIAVRRHNEEVDRNRHVLSKIIDAVKFCGAFELALCGHNESETSENLGIFRGLVDLMASIDRELEVHLANATVFKGTSKTVQNELLDCMLSVLRDRILEEVKQSDYISIQADETTDICSHCQLVFVLRYIDGHNNIQERFFEFIALPNASADTIATALLERLSTILPAGQEKKLIAQAYDGAAVMRGATGGVQRKVQDVYGSAYYVHCYAHQLNLIMQQATSHITKIGQFFSDIGGFSSFFHKSSRRTAVLDEMVAHRLPGASATRWNFRSRAVNTVYEHKDDLVKCFQTIRDSGDFDAVSKREAGGCMRMLEDEVFCFFLALFHKIMPHVDMLFNQLQKRNIDSVFIAGITQTFTDSIQAIRDQVPSLLEDEDYKGPVQEPPPKKRRAMGEETQQHLAIEVCDTILSHAKERFSFTKHLISATLLQGDLFPQHSTKFPDSALQTTVEAYPTLDKARLKTELSLIYENDDFKGCSGALALFQVLMENNLQDTFTETVSLLKILITTPMCTAESERCFSTLKRIKTFLSNTVAQDRLNALAMLSIEKKLTQDIPDFNTRVIERFATQKERRANFLYK